MTGMKRIWSAMISNPLKNTSIDCMVLSVQNGNLDVQNELLRIYQPFVAKCVSEVCKRYINPSEDDEFSIGLFGFNEAMIHYSLEKGNSFFSFADRKSVV